MSEPYSGGLGCTDCDCCVITWKTCWKAFCAPTSPAITSAPVKVKDGSGTVVATGTTDGLGCVTVTLNAAGTYTAYITVSGNDYSSPATTLACGDNTTTNVNVGPIPAAAAMTLTVIGCASAGVPGATVQITDPYGAVTTLTTNSSGQVTYSRIFGGTYNVTVTAPGYNTLTTTRSGCTSWSGFTLTVNSTNYRCCGCGPMPITTLYVTDDVGTLTCTYASNNPNISTSIGPVGAGWYSVFRGSWGTVGYAEYAVICSGGSATLTLHWARNWGGGIFSGSTSISINSCAPLSGTFHVPDIGIGYPAFDVAISA